MGDKRAGYKAGSSYLLNAGLDEIYGITNRYIKPNERRELKGACAREFLVLERMFRSVPPHPRTIALFLSHALVLSRNSAEKFLLATQAKIFAPLTTTMN